MTDPVTSAAVPAAVGAGGIVLAALMPGVDINAVIGAFAGALFLVIFSDDLTAARRVGYLLSSWVFGYFTATELAARQVLQSTGLAAFFGGLLCVVISVGVLEWMKTGKAPWWLKLARRGSRDA